jgi:hypothetical protein
MWRRSQAGGWAKGKVLVAVALGLPEVLSGNDKGQKLYHRGQGGAQGKTAEVYADYGSTTRKKDAGRSAGALDALR